MTLLNSPILPVAASASTRTRTTAPSKPKWARHLALSPRLLRLGPSLLRCLGRTMPQGDHMMRRLATSPGFNEQPHKYNMPHVDDSSDSPQYVMTQNNHIIPPTCAIEHGDSSATAISTNIQSSTFNHGMVTPGQSPANRDGFIDGQMLSEPMSIATWTTYTGRSLIPAACANSWLLFYETDYPYAQISLQISPAFLPGFLHMVYLLSKTVSSCCNLHHHTFHHNCNLFHTHKSFGESSTPSMPLSAHFMTVLAHLATNSHFRSFSAIRW